MPEIVEKSSPWRSGARSYTPSRQASIESLVEPEDSRSSILAIGRIVGSACVCTRGTA
jgi:hypothetical protein